MGLRSVTENMHVSSRRDGAPRRSALSMEHVSLSKERSLGCEAIEVRCFDEGMTVAAQTFSSRFCTSISVKLFFKNKETRSYYHLGNRSRRSACCHPVSARQKPNESWLSRRERLFCVPSKRANLHARAIRHFQLPRMGEWDF